MLLNQTLKYFGSTEDALNNDTLLNDTFLSQSPRQSLERKEVTQS